MTTTISFIINGNVISFIFIIILCLCYNLLEKIKNAETKMTVFYIKAETNFGPSGG